MQSLSYKSYARVLGLASLAATMTWTTTFGAAAQSRTRPVTLDAGTVIPVRLNDTISSNDSQKGDTFTTTIKTSDSNNSDNGYSYSDYGSLPVGTKIEGVVRMARAKNDKDPGVLDLEFRRLRLPNGRSYAIEGSLIGLDNKSVTRTANGRLVAKPNHKNDRLTYVGYGAGAGLLVGLLTKHTLEDTLIGGGLGYLFGALQKGHSDARDVVLKPGTELGVRLDRGLSFTGYGDYRDDNSDNSNSPNDDRYHRAPRSGNDRDTATDIGVLIGDQNVNFDSTARPIMSNNTVLVPVAPVLSAAHVPYQYDSSRKEIRASGDAGVVRLGIGSRIAVVNGSKRVRLETSAQMLNGRVYVPMHFLELATGQKATWDSSSRTVVLNP